MRSFFGILFLAFAFAIASPVFAANTPPVNFSGVSLLKDTTKPKTPIPTDPSPAVLRGVTVTEQKTTPTRTVPLPVLREPACDLIVNFGVTAAGQLGYSFPNVNLGPEVLCTGGRRRIEVRAFFNYTPTGKTGVGGSTINGGAEALLWWRYFAVGGGIEGSRFMSSAFNKHGYNPELLFGARWLTTGVPTRLVVAYLLPTGSSHWGAPASTIQDPMLQGPQFRFQVLINSHLVLELNPAYYSFYEQGVASNRAAGRKQDHAFSFGITLKLLLHGSDPTKVR
jgi:hypothetical protein